MLKKRFVFLLSLPVLLLSCTNDAYDTGDGALSYLRAELVEANTDAAADIVSITLDDDTRLSLTKKMSPEWAEKADTAYRALMYYKQKPAADGVLTAVEPFAMRRVLTPKIKAAEEVKDDIKTDPVLFNSAWKAANGRFINFDLGVKTGKTDDDESGQTIGIICDGVDQRADGTRLIRLRLHHDQGSVPEYYTSQLFLSIPVWYLPTEPSAGDEVEICINTYSGEIKKTFVFKN